MPTNRRRRRFERRADPRTLSRDEARQLLEGFGPAFSNGADADAMFQRWTEFRDEILALFLECQPGMRPYAWWAFEGGDVNYPRHPQRQAERLDAIGKLTDGERERLEAGPAVHTETALRHYTTRGPGVAQRR